MKTLTTKMRRKVSKLFVDPAQSKLVTVLGGTVLIIGRFRDTHGNPLTITLSRGVLLRSERFRRSVIDDMGVLANDVKMAIAIQGADYERDVVSAFERDEWLKEQGWHVRYIPQSMLYSNPKAVRKAVLSLF